MAPKVVNKDERRREIALSCISLVNQGIRKITVSQVAKTAGIGKGTVYEYFENKEDIIFEIINIHIEEHHKAFLETIKTVQSTREKIFIFLHFVLDESDETMQHFKGYQDYLSIVLSDNNDIMKDFNSKCREFFTQQLKFLIDEGIHKGELIPQSASMVNGLICFEKGVALSKMIQKDFDAKSVCTTFIDTLFNLIEVKHDS
ncbi:TetR/AcrR family transcriptional regulator [Candidatus Marinarcus aquaticus]|uniref:TetR/AcrR family transcriptional regulator n=1 Tax=Candidatus Marinarcus aquaticus TaxID=2044504 RepID=UPI0013E98DFE|nr:TetR/AcrR family transcriptional regulator [Candidatus Marinarcus aquaticus]